MQIEKAAYGFRLNGEPVSCEEFGHGHINATYRITTDSGCEYVLQRINKYVFKDPVRLMENASAVTAFLRERAVLLRGCRGRILADVRLCRRFLPGHPRI